jgi:hypothetical protein
MKNLLKKSILSAVVLSSAVLGTLQIAEAGFPSYPPSVSNNYSYFEDSDNPTSVATCKGVKNAICATAYVVPKQIALAKTEAGVPMLSQGIFFKSSYLDHQVVYNLTLEPDYDGYDAASKKIVLTLSQKYGIPAESVMVSPMNISNIQFLVYNTFGSSGSEPVPSATAGATSPSPRPSNAASPALAGGLVYTQTIVPQWTGDFHNIGSQFSVSIVGPVWDLEPGLSNMFLNSASNAVVGQVSFGFAVKALASNSTMDCDLETFQEKVEDQTKVWNITHVTGPGYDVTTTDNEEWNAIRANLKIGDFCTIKEYNDATVAKDDLMESRKQQIFDMLFNKAFQQITNFTPDQIIAGKDAVYTKFNSSSSADANGHIVLNFKDEEVFLLHSDLGFAAGGVSRDNLSPESKYICEHFEKYTSKGCEVVCDPMSEVYLPHHHRAAANGCVDITSIPLTQ